MPVARHRPCCNSFLTALRLLQVSEQYNEAVEHEGDAQRKLEDELRALGWLETERIEPATTCCGKLRRRAATCDWSPAGIWPACREALAKAPALPAPMKRVAQAIVSLAVYDILSLAIIVANVVRREVMCW
jgi:hypothetical protein